MTTSQSDVDKVMAAFGAAPIRYRPNQDDAADFGGRGATAPSAAGPAATPAANADERILPGTGGRVREVFPLLWRAIPVVGDLKVGAINRPGDEVPEAADADTVADARWSASLQPVAPAPDGSLPQQAAPVAPTQSPSGPMPRVVPFVAADAKPAGPFAGETAVRVPASARSARPLPGARTAPPDDAAADTDVSPAHWAQQAYGLEPPATPFAAVPPRPLPPLRSHADLIRPVGQRTASAAPEPPTPPLPSGKFAPVAAEPAAPQPAAPGTMPPTYPGAAHTPPPGYPAYYPPPPPGLQPYPMHPAAAWPQPGYPPPYPPAYALPYPPPPGYPPNYPPGYPPHYPYGYPQQPGAQQPGPQQPGQPVAPEAYAGGYAPGYPPGYGPPQTYPMHPQPQPIPAPEPPEATSPQPVETTVPAVTSPEAAAAPPPPATLSDIFAALHRAPGRGDHGEETPR